MIGQESNDNPPDSANPDPAGPEALSHLRQALREPAHQIVQSAELLLERQRDDLPPGFTSSLQRIHLAGQNLLRLIDEVMDRLPAGADRTELAQARHDLLTPVTHVMGYCGLLQEEAEDTGYQGLGPELDRINTAVQEVFGLITTRFGRSAVPKT